MTLKHRCESAVNGNGSDRATSAMLTCAQQQLLSVAVFSGYLMPMVLLYAFVVAVAVVKLERTTFHAFLLGIAFGDAFAINAEIGLVVQRFSVMPVKYKVFNVFSSSFGLGVGQKAQFVLALTRLASLLRPVSTRRITVKQTVVGLVVIDIITFASRFYFWLPAYSRFWQEAGNVTLGRVITREAFLFEVCHRVFDTVLVIGGAACYIAIALAIRFGKEQSQLKGKEVRILLQGVCVTAGYLFFDMNFVINHIMRALGAGKPRPMCPTPFTWKVIIFYFAVAGNGIVYCFFNKELQLAMRDVIAKPTTSAVKWITVKKSRWIAGIKRRVGPLET